MSTYQSKYTGEQIDSAVSKALAIVGVVEKIEIPPELTIGFIDNKGEKASNTAFQYTQKIPVKAGDIITATYESDTTWKKWRFLCAYSGETVVESAGGENIDNTPYTVPDGVDGIVITIQTAYVKLKSIVKETHCTVEEQVVKNHIEINELLGTIADTEVVTETIKAIPVLTSGFINNAGVFSKHDSFHYTQKIPVKAGDIITTNFASTTTDAWKKWRFLCAYNGETVVESAGAENINYYIVPDGIDSIILSLQTTYVDVTEIVRKTTYKKLVLKDNEVIDAISETVIVPNTLIIPPELTIGFIDSKGSKNTNTAFSYTQKIAVKAGDVLTANYESDTTWRRWRFLCAYNGDTVVENAGIDSPNDGEAVNSYTVPDGVDGIVISIQTAYVKLKEVVKETTYEEKYPKGVYEKANGENISFEVQGSTLNVEYKESGLVKERFAVCGARNYYYNPDLQPDILGNADSFGNIAWTSDDIINNIYEPLRLANPEYITRENLGKDASGLYDIWCYYFTPENYEYTVYLQGGAHGSGEKMGYWGLARIMHLIANAQDNRDGIEELRRKVRFIVVPIVNVWSVTTTGGYVNVNGVNLNRDCLSAAPQAETALILNLMNRYKEEIDFGFDFHTNAGGIEWSFGGYLLVYPHSAPEFWGNRLKRINNYLYHKNLDGTGYRKAFMGENIDYPANSQIDVNANPDYERGTDHESTFASVMWSKYGFLGASLEHGDLHFSDVAGDSIEMTRAVELYLGHIIEQIKCNFKLEKKLWDIQNG
jgi:hypothetical protein